jgi:hypothetical protein
MRRCFNFTHRFTAGLPRMLPLQVSPLLRTFLLIAACAQAQARPDCIVLDYRLPDSADEAQQTSLARGLAAHLDWLHAHGVRLVAPDVKASEPAVCLQFSGPRALLDTVARPLLMAWAAPAVTAPTFTGDEAIDLQRTLVLSPASPLAELIDGLAARGLRVPRAADGRKR